MYFTTAVATAVGLLGINAAAQGLGQTAICPFDGERGPNIMVAVVQLPDGGTEIDAWLYGYNWCSSSNFVSQTGDICTETSGRDDAVEFMHAPFTNRFGAFDPICYANIDIHFFGCEPGENGGFNYDNVVAWVTSKPPDNFGNNAVDAAPQYGPQRGEFGQPPQGAIPLSQAGPQAISANQGTGNQQFGNNQQFGGSNQLSGNQFGGNQGGQPPRGQMVKVKRQQSQSQGGMGQSQNQQLGGVQPAALGSSGNFQPPGQGFNPQQQGSFDPSQQGGSFNPQQQGSFNPQQQGSFNPQQQGSFSPQQQGSFNPQQQQQQQQQGQFGGQPSQFGGQPGQFGGQPGFGGQGQSPNIGGGQQSSFLYDCVSSREHRGCVVNSQLSPASESKISAFLKCGVMAEP